MNSDIEKHIALNVTFEDLPQTVRQLVGNSEKEYNKQVLEYSVKTQLQYRGNLVAKLVKNERLYYEQVVQSSRNQLMLYPYHLAEAVVAGLRVTPFQYYSAALLEIMDQEKSYDALPNFTAVDCVRLLGIGRNQYIELMNQRKSGRARLFMRKPGRELLPALPSPAALQHLQSWWTVRLGRVTQSDVKSNVTASEKGIIDLLIDNGPQHAGDIDKPCILSLYSKGLIYLDVPIESSDRVSVPPLEGFVMNRVTGDHMESLLYRVFVSIDEHSTVQELASVLGTELALVKMAVSLFCRLGFAQRKPRAPTPSGVEGGDRASPPLHPSWEPETPATGAADTSAIERTQEELLLLELESALCDDPSLYLERNLEPAPPPCGVLGPGGVGAPLSLPSATTPVDITASLHTPTVNRTFADHPSVLGPPGAGTLSSSAFVRNPGVDVSGALQTSSSSSSGKKRIAFLFDSTLTAFLMMGNLSPDLKNHAVTLFEVGKLPDEGLDSLIHELSKIPQCVSEGEAERYFTHALTLRTALTFLRNNPALGSNQEGGCALDLVRWESLSHLDPATTARLLNKNYRLLVSMSPLHCVPPHLPCPTPPHFGPPAPPAATPWFRLLLYAATGSGPDTLLLPRGYRLRRLPRCLWSQRRVLVAGWGQEPSLLPLSQLLPTANEALTHHPLLLQGYGWQEEALTQHVCLPLEKDDVWWQCPGVRRAVERLHLYHTFGYLHLIAFPPSATPPPTPPPPALSSTLQGRPSPQDGGDVTAEDMVMIEDPLSDVQSSGGVDAGEQSAQEQQYQTRLLQQYDWLLLDCHFGLPLFDASLNTSISHKIARHKLLAEASVELFAEEQQLLVKKLDQFIQEYKGYDAARSGIPEAGSYNTSRSSCTDQPAQPLQFSDGRLTVWDGH